MSVRKTDHADVEDNHVGDEDQHERGHDTGQDGVSKPSPAVMALTLYIKRTILLVLILVGPVFLEPLFEGGCARRKM